MIDLSSELDLDRLFNAMDGARDALAPFRRNRLEMVKAFVGNHYSDDGADVRTIVNLMQQTADLYTIALAAQCPRVKITTQYRELWPFAFRYTQSLNNLIKEMRLERTLQKIVLDAFFTVGIAKVYRGDAGLVQLDEDVWADPGKPYVDRISIDDFLVDMSVADIRKAKFIGDEYRVSWQRVQDEELFDRAVVAKLAPTSKYDNDQIKTRQISAGAITDHDEYEPMITLIDVYLPELNVVATFAKDARLKPLIVRQWDGPEGGPYHILDFCDVPDNLLGLAPAANLKELHDLYNALFCKQAAQARRQKTNPVFAPGAEGDAERMRDAKDGQWVKSVDPQKINVVSQGGVDPANVAFSITVGDMFDRMGGNVSAMGGLGQQAATYGQEQLIYGAVGRAEGKRLQRVHAFTAEVLRDTGHLMWYDAMMSFPVAAEHRPGSGIYVESGWSPEQREGDFWQYNFDVVPFSMAYEPPEIKLQKLERAMDFAGKLLPAIEAGGGTLDVQEIFEDYAEALGAPEVKRWFTFAVPSTYQRPGPEGESSHLPQKTTREYVRRNVPTGGTPQARSQILQQMALGKAGGASQSQRAALMRQ